ncbi:hypothetical protein MSPP1_000476 [Malassezia sp. CBS 17886]|nr:hypothetical protein MSPP1_000476 [Malassezia sp. CBS 17886]
MRNAATQEALRSAMRYRHGAIITKGGKILGQGHNHVRTGFSGPLSAHDAVVLPGHGGDGCACDAEHTPRGGAFAHAYFSMHAEMHAITSALRGARPQAPRTSVVLDPGSHEQEASHTSTLSPLTQAVGSRGSDAPTEGKTKCDRALVEASGVLNRALKNEMKKNQRHARADAPSRAGGALGASVGNQEARRRRTEFLKERARHLEQRKQEKRERKARGARAASSGSSCTSDSATTDSSLPSTPPLLSPRASRELLKTASADAGSIPTAYRRIARTPGAARGEALDTRIRGADLYVVRLLQDVDSKAKAKEQRRRHQRGVAPAPTAPVSAPRAQLRYADSRPCWRCLEWMHWAGVKRVYWTDAEGEWDGGKVAELLFGAAGASSIACASDTYVPVHVTQYEHAAVLLRGADARGGEARGEGATLFAG